MKVPGRVLLSTFLALAAWGYPVASTPPQPQSTDVLVDAIVKAYGGAAAVSAVRSYRLEAIVDAIDRGERGEVTRIVVAPATLKVLVRYPSMSELRVVDGATGQRGTSPHDLVAVQGPMLGSMMVQAARANLPWILAQRRSDVRMLESIGSGDVLELRLGEGLVLRATVDPRSRLITESVGLVSAGPMQIPFRTTLADHREVNGVLFPFHEENYASGRHTGTTSVTKIVVNPPAAQLEVPEAR